jgi:hypothetical protein
MPRVFVLEPCRQNLEDAKRFGNVTYLFAEEGSRSSIWAEGFLVEIVKALTEQGYNPAEDYFLIAGGMAPNVTAVATIASAFGRFKTLLFDAKANSYLERKLG